MDLNKLKQNLVKLQLKCKQAKEAREEAIADKSAREADIESGRQRLEAARNKIAGREKEIAALQKVVQEQRESTLQPLMEHIEALAKENQAKKVELESRWHIRNDWERQYAECLAAERETTELREVNLIIKEILHRGGPTLLKAFIKGNPYPAAGGRSEKTAWIRKFAVFIDRAG